MSTSTKRRHDDYQPASLRRFWQTVRNLWWTLEDRMAWAFAIAQIALMVAVGTALVALALYILANLFWG